MNSVVDYFLKIIPIALVFTIPYLIIRALYMRKKKISFIWHRETALWIFSMFIAVFMIYTLESRYETRFLCNLRPLKSIRQYFWGAELPIQTRIVNLIGNFLIFAPFGFLPPLIWKKACSFWRLFVIGSIFIISIELIQFFIGRVADVDDYILNITGFMIGYAFYAIIRAVITKENNK
ncbi:VanZ family protein [Treponema sp. R6D11]